jgi:hypothetical protein
VGVDNEKPTPLPETQGTEVEVQDESTHIELKSLSPSLGDCGVDWWNCDDSFSYIAWRKSNFGINTYVKQIDERYNQALYSSS